MIKFEGGDGNDTLDLSDSGDVEITFVGAKVMTRLSMLATTILIVTGPSMGIAKRQVSEDRWISAVSSRCSLTIATVIRHLAPPMVGQCSP